METIWEMLERHRKQGPGEKAARLQFLGVEGYDVYNPTAPFRYRGEKLLCARVEKRDSESSRAIFFREKEQDVYEVLAGWKQYPLQDPCVTKILDKYVLGGTLVYSKQEEPGRVFWHTTFYYGNNLEDLEWLADGPEGMKDVRMVELADQRIGIFTRPQGEKGGRGKIGFTVAEDFGGITTEAMAEAPLLDLFHEDEWGGVNEAVLLANGRIGVLGHIACFRPEEVRHYFPMAFVFDPVTGEHTQPQILAERAEFLPGPWKRPDLADVLFSGGLRRETDGRAVLYVGVSDCEVQRLAIADPFGESAADERI